MDTVVRQMALAPLLDRHPFDLSGGEQQRAALAKVLMDPDRARQLREAPDEAAVERLLRATEPARTDAGSAEEDM